MILFACGSCNKQIEVKDELAGKSGKCPGCGQPVVVPALAAATPASQADSPDIVVKTLPPSFSQGAEERTLPPKNSNQSGKESLFGSGGETALGAGSAPDGAPGADLWDFLAPAQSPDEIGRLGKYRVRAILGRGGMGVVFRAHDPHLDRFVALKAMLPSLATSPSAKERFFREAKAAAALKHPHVVTIHDVGEDRGAPYLAMELLEGESLDDRLKRENRLPVSEVLLIGREIAKGLAAAHDKGLIHRDIKPGNVWLEGNEGHVKILDFGLARAMGDQAHLTQSGAIIGTPAYMAPEQAGGKQVDRRCDLFSLGCVLYLMCTGEMPFKGNDTISILSALALEDPAPPVSLNLEIPTELSDFVMQLLAKKPEERPESATKVVQVLQEIEDPTCEMKVPLPPAPTSSGGRRWAIPAVIAVILGVSLLAYQLLPRGEKSAPSGVDWRNKESLSPPSVVERDEMRFDLGNGVTLEVIKINAMGKTFLMGSPKNELGRDDDEEQHEVTFGHDFYMGKYEVTQEEYEAIMDVNPSQVKGARLPVETVSWNDAQDFMKKLNEKFKERKVRFHLPSEAEWEYACRGGTTTPFHFGKVLNGKQANCRGDMPYGTAKQGPYLETTTRVGSYAANAFGLFDMHGNVFEWCEDYYGPYSAAPTDGKAQSIKQSDAVRVLRGGYWGWYAGGCRSARRGNDAPDNRDGDDGFRVAVSQD